MPKPQMQLGCAYCDFTTTDAEAYLVHMIETGHGLDPDLQNDLRESGLYSELQQIIDVIQSGAELPAGVDLHETDDEDIPEHVKAHFKKAMKRHRTTDAKPTMKKIAHVEHTTKPYIGEIWGYNDKPVMRVDLHHDGVPVPCRTCEIDIANLTRESILEGIEAALESLIREEERHDEPRHE